MNPELNSSDAQIRTVLSDHLGDHKRPNKSHAHPDPASLMSVPGIARCSHKLIDDCTGSWGCRACACVSAVTLKFQVVSKFRFVVSWREGGHGFGLAAQASVEGGGACEEDGLVTR